MRKFSIIYFLFLLLFTTGSANSVEIVYPKKNNVTINSSVTFFVGNENAKTNLEINGQRVDIHPSGGFYYPVKLNFGENIFNIVSENGDSKIYIINRPKNNTNKTKKINPIEYDSPISYLTNNDNVPLRNAPSDRGDTRLQHLQRGILLNIIGEYGSYYKVQLARDDYAWISKNLVTKATTQDNEPAKLISYTYNEDKDKRIFNVKLSKKVPYILSENRSYNLSDTGYEPYTKDLSLVVYNIDGQPENKYALEILGKKDLFGYKSFYNDSNELVIEVKNRPVINKKLPLKNIKITIDAGHGGSEYGAIGCLGNKEKDINLAIALMLKDLLKEKGAKVLMTREKDTYIPLYKRVSDSQKFNSDIFISLHANAIPDSLAESYPSGTSVYYFYTQSSKLAKDVKNALVENLSTKDDKVRQESFAVIRNTESLSILVELGYMINPDDNAKLVSSEFQLKAAQSIVQALEKYLNDL